MGELGIRSDQTGNGSITLFNLFFQGPAKLPGLTPSERVIVVLGVVAFVGKELQELATALGQVGQLLLLGRSRWCGGWLEGCPIGGQHGGIYGIGLGPLALGAGEVTDTPGFNNANGNTHRVEHPHTWLFITTDGFANNMSLGMAAEEFEELSVAPGIIGQGMKTTREVELQRALGNIEADIEEVVIVLTHTCGYELR